MRERIAWTRRQLYDVDERIAILTEELWMTLNEEHYSTAKKMISASSARTFNKARSTQIAKFTKLTSYQHLEPKLFDLKNDVASNVRVQITEVLRRAKLPRSNLTKNMKDAVRNLRADKSIHILKADKGNATVVLDRVEYDNKVLALLNTNLQRA